MRVQPMATAGNGEDSKETDHVAAAEKTSRIRTNAQIEYVDEVVALTPVVRRLLWFTIFVLLVFNAALLGILAVQYMQNEKNDSLLWLFRLYFLFSDGNAFLMKYSTRVAAGYGVLCAIFVLVALRLVGMSISHGYLRFGTRRARLTRSVTSRMASSRVQTVLKQPKRAVDTLKYWHSKWHGAFGVRGPYFDIRLLVEEVFEISGQTAAAYSASQSISNVPLNIIYAVVIFVNSVSAFVFRRVFQTSLIKQRLACLMTDLVLDFVWGTLLPIWMYVPIVKIYLDRAHVIDYLTSFSNSTREIERVLIISWKYYLLSVIPFVNSLINFLELQSILKEMWVRPASAGSSSESSGEATFLEIRYPVGRRRHGRLVRLAHVLLPIYGIAVLVMSLSSNGVFKSPPHQVDVVCMHRVYPWFSTKEACLGRQINCTMLGIEGTKAQLSKVFEEFDRSSLADLFLIRCPGLEMPSMLQEFDQLMSIVIKESTLVEWDEAAALRDDVFKGLRTIQVFETNFTNDPIGLTGREPIATSIEWIHLEAVDGTRLLSLVGDHWRGVLYFDCMWCGLVRIPEAMYHMPRLTMSSLAWNDIQAVPEDWIPRSQLQLQMIWFDMNIHLRALPDSLWRQAATCGIFSMTATNLSVVPEWVADIAGPDFLITAALTPVCDGLVELSPRVKPLVSCTALA